MTTKLKTAKKIAVIGLGYVGLPLAIEFGKQIKTIGFDINKNRINDLLKGNDDTLQISKEEIDESKKIKFSSNGEDLKDCSVYIITVPTPVDDVNSPDLRSIENASLLVGKYLEIGDTVIYESTVYPGCTEEFCVPILEATSNLKFNIDFSCGYSPERINPGDKKHTLTSVIKITSGSNETAAQEIDDLYASIVKAGTYKAKSIKVAEAAKVIENTQRDINIALVNELSIIFQKLEIDTLDVLQAAETKWNFMPFRPGIVGGHCIGVDPYYLTYKAEKVGYNPQVILSGRRINDGMAKHTADNLIRLMIQNKIDVSNSHIGIMGVTFKENCTDIRNSKVFDIVQELKKWNVNVSVEDPWADPKEVYEYMGIKIEKLSHKYDSIILAVGHDEYKALDPKDIYEKCNNDSPVLVDLKGIFNRQEAEETGFTVFRL